MKVLSTSKQLSFDDAAALVDEGAAFVDLRPIDQYVAGHIPGSLALLYESGPGMASRARDCLPLDLELVLLDAPRIDFDNAAAALRGKGFAVVGKVDDWQSRHAAERGSLAITEVLDSPPESDVILDVNDPGANAPEDSLRIPLERLWVELEGLDGVGRIVVAAGVGVRAALAVGMLERGGVTKVQLWRRSRK